MKMVLNEDEGMSAPLRPAPPVVGKVNHHSIELYWDKGTIKNYDMKRNGRLRFVVQEQDTIHGGFGTVYTGYANSHVFEGLETESTYKYRLRVMNNHGDSEWSPLVTVSTTKEPYSGEHLHKAILRGDVNSVKKILSEGTVNIEATDKLGFTPLMNAAQKGHCNIVDMLFEAKADVNTLNSAGKDALMLCSFAGHLNVARQLCHQGAKMTLRDRSGTTCLHWAVDGGNLNLIEWLIKEGAEIEAQDNVALWTPLMRCAALGGNVMVARSLLTAGANVNCKDKDGKTPLMTAAFNGHHMLVKLLVQNNADLNVKNAYGKSALEMAVSFDRTIVVRYLEEAREAAKKKEREVKLAASKTTSTSTTPTNQQNSTIATATA